VSQGERHELERAPEHSGRPGAEDVLRVWACGRLSIELRESIGTAEIDDYRAWGMLVADAVQHVVDALASEDDPSRARRRVRRILDRRLGDDCGG
jgi:hypothetical protein